MCHLPRPNPPAVHGEHSLRPGEVWAALPLSVRPGPLQPLQTGPGGHSELPSKETHASHVERHAPAHRHKQRTLKNGRVFVQPGHENNFFHPLAGGGCYFHWYLAGGGRYFHTLRTTYILDVIAQDVKS